MFGSIILDVAAGIIFGFLAISLFTSAAVEAINSILNARSKNLRTGIMALVNDPHFTGLAKELYSHALISPLGPGAADPLKNAPAYIDKTQFAEALLEITGLSAATPAAAAQAPAVQAAVELKARVDALSAERSHQPADQAVASGNGHALRWGHHSSQGRSCELVRQRDGSVKRSFQATDTMDDLCDRTHNRVCRQPGHHSGGYASLGATCSCPEVEVGVHRRTSTKERRRGHREWQTTCHRDKHASAGGFPGRLATRSFFRRPGRKGQLASFLGRVSFGLVSTSHWLVHYRCRCAVRRALLVRHAPVDHSPQRIGP